MFMVEDPIRHLPLLMQKIKEFGDLAGFYINKDKSKVMCKNMTGKKQEELQRLVQCEVVKKRLSI